MSHVRYRARYRRIVFFFARILINVIFWDLLLPQLGLRKWSQRTRSSRLRRSSARFRILAIQMGGVLIKIGQFLSARADILPAEVTSELSGLQDEVPEEDFDDIRRVIETEFQLPLQDKFLDFDPHPEAAASLGQVHRARVGLASSAQPEELISPAAPADLIGTNTLNVVVKIQRPDIENLIAADLAALRTISVWIRRYKPISKRANVPALVAEFTRILYEEIDYLAEGRNAEIFTANFRQRPGVRVPAVIWTHTTKRVLTLKDVRGIKITDFEAITAAGISCADVADRLFQTYLQQIFEDGFFHADPHPGNLFVSTSAQDQGETRGDASEQAWLLTFVDFGMVGRVPPNLLAGMREMAIAIGTRDAKRMVKSYQMMGVLLPNADLSLLEKAEAMAFERFWGKSMSELLEVTPQEMVEFAREFRQLIYSLPFQVPEDLILLGRTVGILSGLCTGLNPDFNVWKGLAPFARKLIAEQGATFRTGWIEQLGEAARSLLTYPRRVATIMEKLERGELSTHDPRLAEQVNRLERAISRAAGSIVFTGLTLSSIQLYLAGEIILAGAGGVAAVLALGWTFFSGRRGNP